MVIIGLIDGLETCQRQKRRRAGLKRTICIALGLT